MLSCRGTSAHLIRVAGGPPLKYRGVGRASSSDATNQKATVLRGDHTSTGRSWPRSDLYSPRVAGPLRYLLLRLYRLEQLDESRGQIAVLVIAVACRSRHSDGEAADPPGCGKVARPKSELVAELAIDVRVTDEAHAVPAVADRADAIGAGHAQVLTGIVVDEGAVLPWLLLIHKRHIVVLIILSFAFVFCFLLPWDAGTAARGDQSCRRLQPVREVGHADTERSRIVIATGAT